MPNYVSSKSTERESRVGGLENRIIVFTRSQILISGHVAILGILAAAVEIGIVFYVWLVKT